MKTGILLTNLGTPDSPTKLDLKRYLSEFLSDSRVVNPDGFFKKIAWKIVLHSIILRKRPEVSAKNYAKIWDKFGPGSPLLNITKLQLLGVKAILKDSDSFADFEPEFELGMRYGNPSIASALRNLRAKQCEKIIVLPLYPQNSSATTLSTLDAINNELDAWPNKPKLVFIEQYHQNPEYIQALSNSVAEYQLEHGQADKLIMSFHGVPQRYIDNGDVYYDHCSKTAELLAKSLGLGADDYLLSFQSVFGKEEWLKPYTDATLKSLPSEGVKHVQVICPGFSADCLETLEEIDQENREYFMQAGGVKFGYIPALNDRKDHIKALSSIVADNL